MENSRGDVERGKCEADFERSYTESIQGHWFDGGMMVVLGLLLQLLAWLLFWIAWRVARWVYAGFSPNTE